jgi:hypothetical protein
MVDEYLMPSGDFQQQALNIHQPFFYSPFSGKSKKIL